MCVVRVTAVVGLVVRGGYGCSAPLELVAACWSQGGCWMLSEMRRWKLVGSEAAAQFLIAFQLRICASFVPHGMFVGRVVVHFVSHVGQFYARAHVCSELYL